MNLLLRKDIMGCVSSQIQPEPVQTAPNDNNNKSRSISKKSDKSLVMHSRGHSRQLSDDNSNHSNPTDFKIPIVTREKITLKPEDDLDETIIQEYKSACGDITLSPEIKYIYNNLKSAVLITDNNGKILFANGIVKRRLKYDACDLIDKNLITDLISREHRNIIKDYYESFLSQFSRRLTIKMKNGKQMWVEIQFINTESHINVFIIPVQLEMRLGHLLDCVKEENRYLKNNIINKVFPNYILPYIKSGKEDFLLNHEDIIIGAFDIVNYTEECLLNKASFTILRPLYYEADRLCEKHDISLIEIIGDAMIVAGNCTKDYKNKVEDIIDFMLDFIKFCQTTTDLDIRCGVSIGKAISGMIGYNQFRYHVFGTAVNLAARMEHLSKHNCVKITDRVFEHLKNKNQYNIEKEPDTFVKGIGMMDTYDITPKEHSEDSPNHLRLRRTMSESSMIESPFLVTRHLTKHNMNFDE